uniref:Uncharacterized protein n=1 Tax=Melopsittacus undulatus TaxID=13146 RepID=A0A8V5GEJ1_MELUD
LSAGIPPRLPQINLSAAQNADLRECRTSAGEAVAGGSGGKRCQAGMHSMKPGALHSSCWLLYPCITLGFAPAAYCFIRPSKLGLTL